ncbi:MAG: regulatory protein GemA [Hydrogenobacter thermophilus]|nr:regulatory protein GemA [Hydrogenobacter thermophilus]
MWDKKITKGQIRIIHTLKSRLGWDDSRYRSFLMWNTDRFVTSSKELSFDEAERIIIKMIHEAVRKGVWQHMPKKYEDLNGRDRMATAAQLRKIEAMWAGLCKAKTEKGRERALRKLLWNKFRVGDLRFLEGWQVKKVIRMLEAMHERQVSKV